MQKRNKKVEIPIMTCFDKNYVIPAAVAFYSLLEHANPEYFYKIYILHSDISDEQQNKLKENIDNFKDYSSLEFVNMDHKFDNIWNKIYQGGHFSKEVMYKILIASIFPQYEKIIITDVDVVFLGDVSKSYLEFDEKSNDYLGVVKPVGKALDYMKNYKRKWTNEEIKKLSVFCGGYLIANLNKIREDNMEKVLIDSFVKNGPRLLQMEQDVLNLCCYSKTKFLNLNHVVCSYVWDLYKSKTDFKEDINYSKKEIENAMNNPIQLHYATSIKPWKDPSCTKGEIWFEYLLKTNMINDYVNILPKIIRRIETLNISPATDEFSLGLKNYIKNNPTFFIKSKFWKRIFKRIFGFKKRQLEEINAKLKEKEKEIEELKNKIQKKSKN